MNAGKSPKQLLFWLHPTSFQLDLSEMVLLSGSPHLSVWLFATLNTYTRHDMVTHHVNVLLVESG